MAIRDYDGTSNHEIGKLYDYDGTSNHQIGKVYDYDGTSNHLIYSADYEIFNNGAKVNYTTYKYSGSPVILNIGTTIYSQLQWTVDQSIVRFPVNLTDLKSISFTISSISLQNNGGLRCGISTRTSNGEPSIFINDQWIRYSQPTKAGTYTVDVSSLSGTYQVCLSFGCSTGNGGNYTCTSIIGNY